jgi:hypothetical protein
MAHFHVEMGESAGTNDLTGGQTMAISESLESVQDKHESVKEKSSKSKLAGNFRRLGRAGASALCLAGR